MIEPALKPASRRTFTRSYPGEAGQARQVRAALALLLEGCPLADEALLVASELCANAAIHSRSAAGGQFTVRAGVCCGCCVWIEVEDQGGPWAQREERDDGRPHGLHIVDALAGTGNWGVDGDSGHGRTVWARLDWPGTS